MENGKMSHFKVTYGEATTVVLYPSSKEIKEPLREQIINAPGL